MIFKIGEYDFTRCIVVGSATVNDIDIPTLVWTDGNGITHKSGIKTKASGTIDLHMRDDSFLANFRNALKTLKSEGGYYPVTAFINNTGEEKPFNAFLTATPSEDIVGNRRTLADFSITIEEV